MTAVDIPPVSKPVREVADDQFRNFWDEIDESVRQAGNWKVKKRILTDFLVMLTTAHMEHERKLAAAEDAAAEAAAAAGDAPAAGRLDGEGAEPAPQSKPAHFPLSTILVLHVGGLLEGLGEAQVSCAEQAVFYLMSIHPEHRQAAERWLAADFRNRKSLRRLLRADRQLSRFIAYLEHAEGAEAEGAYDDGDDDDDAEAS